MRCKYCGAENRNNEPRCVKCQQRLSPAVVRRATETYPVIETATAPALAPAPPRLAAVVANPEPAKRQAPAIQPPLFLDREPRKLVGLDEYNPALRQSERGKSASQPRAVHRRVPAPGQTSFDFGPPPRPAQPFKREMARRTDFPVASLRLRAMATLFDAGIALLFVAAFLLTTRLCLGELPLSTPFLICYLLSLPLIAFAHKLLYCMFGQVTLGLQGAHLRLVSFDGQPPAFSQRFVRLFAGWLSLASAGMGVLWSLADQERLSWHDHISQTFLTHDPRQDEEDEE